MSADASDLLNSLGFLLEGENLNVVRREVETARDDSPGLDVYVISNAAVRSLVSQGTLARTIGDRVLLAIEIAKLTRNNTTVMEAVDRATDVNSTRDFALRFDTATLAQTLSPDHPPSDAVAAEASSIRAATFNSAPTPTVQGMVVKGQIRLASADPDVKAYVVGVLSNLDNAAIGTAPIASVPNASPDAFEAVPAERREAVTHELKRLARVANIAPTTKAMESLANKGITTALAIANVPKETFVQAVADSMPAAVASEVHANAVNTVIGNENVLLNLLQLIKGTGLQAIDGATSAAARKWKVQEVAAAKSLDLNFESLFGSMDQCVCDDCTTVYSPASYFVDLLQYLRAGTVKWPVAALTLADTTAGSQPSIQGTVLEKLFRRRPDLGNLQLTCENTNTVLPYIDLANEVMESFIVNLGSLSTSGDVRSNQVSIDVYNVIDEDTDELLSQPQHTNFSAYQALAAASYPLSLPYHQPIDAQRPFLEFLGVPRLDLLDAFRKKPPVLDSKLYAGSTSESSTNLQRSLVKLQDCVSSRQVDAETLGLVQEDYLILTGEVFFPLEFFAVTEKISLTKDQYQSRTGLLPPFSYWGYPGHDELRSADEATRSGLQFVKHQFLPRSGIAYEDLVSIIETNFINPRQPRGRDKTIFDELQFSYRFLQTLVDKRHADPKLRLAKLTDFLVRTSGLIHLSKLLAPATPVSSLPGHSHDDSQGKSHCSCDDDIRAWVFDKFESLGKLIVLDSGEGPRLPIEGNVIIEASNVKGAGSDTTTMQSSTVGYLSTDGIIRDPSGTTVANVTIEGKILMGSAVDNITISQQYGDSAKIRVDSKVGITVGTVGSDGTLIVLATNMAVEWQLVEGMGGGCNIDNVRLIHLDGTLLTLDEWNRLQKFVRLWKKLGWSVEDTDMAVSGVSTPTNVSQSVDGQGDQESPVTFDNFGDGFAPTEAPTPTPAIGPDTIHELAAIKKLVPLIGLPLGQLLVFWTNMPTARPNSLYRRLFFRSNLRDGDAIFGPDENGDYFAGAPAKISDNLLVILAAFNMKADDVAFLMTAAADNSSITTLPKPVEDVVTIENLSAIYRYGLLARFLEVQVSDMGQILAGGFPDPFHSPSNCLDLIQTWRQVQNARFTWSQLRYVADDIPADLDPLGPSTKTVLQTAKTLHDGIIEMKAAQKVPDLDAEVTEDMVKTKASLIYDETVVAGILQLLSGQTVYLTGAPSVDNPDQFNKDLARASSSQASYIPGDGGESSQLKVVGILNKDQMMDVTGLLDPALQPPAVLDAGTSGAVLKGAKGKVDAKAAATFAQWSDTMRRYAAQTRNLFLDSLVGIFPPELVALEMNTDTATILAPDVEEEAATKNLQLAALGKKPSQKRRYFLDQLLPFLQDKLARVLIQDTFSSAAGFQDRIVAQTMLERIAMDKATNITTMEVLLDKLQAPEVSAGGTWSGYLAPLTSDSYTFSVSKAADSMPPLELDGGLLHFAVQQEDPKRLWSTTSPTRLDSGKLYSLTLYGIKPEDLQWKATAGSRSKVPSTILLPKQAEDQLRDAFVRLQKLAIVVNNFKLDSEDVVYINNHPTDFEHIDFMHLKVKHLQRLAQFVSFRKSLPAKTDIRLLELFNWASNNPNANRESLVAKISAATAWKPFDVGQMLDNLWFSELTSGETSSFANEVNLVRFARLTAISSKLGVGIARLFDWATPRGTSPGDFLKLHEVAEEIQKAARSRYNLQTWPKAVKAVNDALREKQKNALIAHLLVQDVIISLGIRDADGLFEYFLIDTQMTPLVETSRIKQAISTIQLYVQRCFLGLEEAYGVPVDALNRTRWDWMQKYRVWEANRKVFLYPENWIDPSLRDDKSDLFKALESELLQKSLDKDTVAAALRTFLHGISEVSSLTVVGLCVDYTDAANPIHLFARTRTAPFVFYHNKYSSSRWADWKKMAIEVPSYTVEAPDREATVSGPAGVYFAPMAFQNRLVVFIPQIIKKTIAPTVAGNFNTIGNDAAKVMARDAWEIKLSWTELRNGAWTPRQLCPNGIIDDYVSIDSYVFIPTAVVSNDASPSSEAPSIVKVLVARQHKKDATSTATVTKTLAEWHFQNCQLSFAGPVTSELTELPSGHSSFGYFDVGAGNTEIHSLQAFQSKAITAPLAKSAPCSTNTVQSKASVGSSITLAAATGSQPLYHPSINKLMSASMRSNGTAVFPELSKLEVGLSGVAELVVNFGANGYDNAKQIWTFDEQSRPFSLYNWELGLHAPMTLIDRLLKAQQFDQALDACHYVFNPTATGSASDMSRFWVFAPFKLTKAQTVEQMFESFEPGTERPDVTAWRDNPFSPHVIARGRPLAYMKWIVMKYIEILIEYGDFYFLQNTLETIPNAIQMYILASHLYGPRAQKITRQGKVKAYTYNNLLNRFDAFSNAMVQMEDAFPFSNQTSLPVGKMINDTEVQMANVFGFAATLLFAIPDNPDLRALGEKIDDRLFKIRHAQDIQGIFRKLPLFEPPIDPALLVQATAQGLSLNSLLTDLNGPMPNYRLQYLLGRALDLAQEVKSFGQALLSAQEKQDAEAYAVLRATQEMTSQSLIMEIKKLALDEAQSNLESLQYSRKGPVNRMRYYLKQAGEDASAIPEAAAEFRELNEKLQDPVDVGGLKFLPSEKEEMDLQKASSSMATAVAALEMLAGGFNAGPSTGGHATPLGCGAVVNWGLPNLGQSVSAVARGSNIASIQLGYWAGMAGRKAGALRALNERLQAANAAGYEISSIDKQIAAGRIRVALAGRDVESQQRLMDQARETEAFLRSKYTSAELYGWIFGQTRALFYSTYKQAYDLARKVEKAFKFERPQLAGQVFIQPGYWDAGRDGCLAGERLYAALKALEATYIADRGHDYEITKHVSLRQLDPMQLLRLREAGAAEFAIPEVHLDMDYPGHYCRRLVSVALTIPCVVGPYASVNATLRLLSHRFRVSTALNGSAGGGSGGAYAEDVSSGPGGDPRFATTNVPIAAMAASSGQSDAGVFELTFGGDRYMPFEGAGAISSWRLELPTAAAGTGDGVDDEEGMLMLRPFDYGTISDVVLTLRYTSLEGGAGLKAAARRAVSDFAGVVAAKDAAGGLFALFDVRSEFAGAWAAGVLAGSGVLELGSLRERLPIFAIGRGPGGVVGKEIYLLSDGRLPTDQVEVDVGGKMMSTLRRQDGVLPKGMSRFDAFVDTAAEVPVESWTLRLGAVAAGGSAIGSKRLWLLVRYSLK